MDTGKPIEEEIIRPGCNEPFYWTKNSNKRIIVHQGGTGSGKTFSVLQYLIFIATTLENKVIDIGRRTLKALKSTAYSDFLIILSGLPYDFEENKTDLIYKFETGSRIQFFGLDDPQKVRSRRRDYLYLNEVNEMGLEMWRQLSTRTREKIIVDFNPSDPIHWIYEEVQPREDAETFISTYKHNEYLSEGEKNEIESYKDKDPEYWRVFGEGKRGVFLKGQIFKNWEKISTLPEEYEAEFYGLDFGYSNDPNAVVRIRKQGLNVYIQEVLYEKGLTNPEIAKRLIDGGIGNTICYCDSAEPKSIKELKNHGINAVKAIKGPSSILPGINHIKTYNVHLTEDSPKVWNEYYFYRWEMDKNEEPTNRPKDFMNHSIDAIRYALYTRYFKNQNDWTI
jgi:phage terminase large subunit